MKANLEVTQRKTPLGESLEVFRLSLYSAKTAAESSWIGTFYVIQDDLAT